MEIQVSIIIPSFNKYPLNLFTLYSLENQTFDHSKFEVIFIDDASNDKTEEALKTYNPSYHFRYLRFEKNVGRAKARNIGIQQSRGDIIIFLDAEMLVEPDFIYNHYQKHQEHKDLVLSGVMYISFMYSCVYPQFNKPQLHEIRRLVRRDKVKYSRLNNASINKDTTIYELITREDIDKQNYQSLITTKPYFTDDIVENFDNNLTNFHMPWMLFLTGNVSIPKELITRAGNFDEEFVKYGYEDWELGYRLYKLGAKFMGSEEVIGYHQEHPVAESKWHEAVFNYHMFTTKHPDVDVLVLGLELSRMTEMLTVNSILEEYKSLQSQFPTRFNNIKNSFIEILQTIALLLKLDIRHKKLMEASGIHGSYKNDIISEINELKSLNKCPHLTKLYNQFLQS